MASVLLLSNVSATPVEPVLRSSICSIVIGDVNNDRVDTVTTYSNSDLKAALRDRVSNVLKRCVRNCEDGLIINAFHNGISFTHAAIDSGPDYFARHDIC